MMAIAERIRRLMADIFQIDLAAFGADITPQTVAVWDSLAHIRLMLALEREFKIEIPDERIVTLASFSEIVRTVAELAGC
ncbi:MAG: acyl carrier protein [Acidobacteriota bacterium]